ncbi:MAG: acyl carrier protein [Pirellulaceae bacterium]|nr:acyl carrier protein [Pirellulaceae bacterium]
MTELSEELKILFSDELRIATENIKADTSLFSSGIIDSFQLVSLMILIEKKYDIGVNSVDVSLDNFDSAEKIAAYISRTKAE